MRTTSEDLIKIALYDMAITGLIEGRNITPSKDQHGWAIIEGRIAHSGQSFVPNNYVKIYINPNGTMIAEFFRH